VLGFRSSLPPLCHTIGLVRQTDALGDVRTARQAVGRASRHPVVLLADCRDVEVTYDPSFGGRPNAPMTRVAIDALKSGSPPASSQAWYQRIQQSLPSADYSQTPQLCGRARLPRPDRCPEGVFVMER
jgi:hypothetical protein